MAPPSYGRGPRFRRLPSTPAEDSDDFDTLDKQIPRQLPYNMMTSSSFSSSTQDLSSTPPVFQEENPNDPSYTRKSTPASELSSSVTTVPTTSQLIRVEASKKRSLSLRRRIGRNAHDSAAGATRTNRQAKEKAAAKSRTDALAWNRPSRKKDSNNATVDLTGDLDVTPSSQEMPPPRPRPRGEQTLRSESRVPDTQQHTSSSTTEQQRQRESTSALSQQSVGRPLGSSPPLGTERARVQSDSAGPGIVDDDSMLVDEPGLPLSGEGLPNTDSLEGEEIDGNDDEGIYINADNPFGLTLEAQSQIAAYHNGTMGSEDDRIPATSSTQGTRTDPPSVADPSQFMAAKNISRLNPLRLNTREELAEMYRAARSQGGKEFVRFIYDQEINCATVRLGDRESTLHEAFMYYLTYFPEIIDGLVDGDLPMKLADENSVEYAIEQRYRERAAEAKHPGVYLNVLVDEQGRSPIVSHLRKALADFSTYCSTDGTGDDLSNEIDRQISPRVDLARSRRGFRKYLCHDDSGEPIGGRYECAGSFVTHLLRVLNAVEREQSDKPLRDFLVEMGFSVDLFSRMEDHTRQWNSNFLMGLFESCLERLYPGVYSFKQYILHLIANFQHAALSEIMATRIGQGYLTSGTGFGHYPAGRSVNMKLSIQEAGRNFEWIEQNTRMNELLDEEIERMQSVALPQGMVGQLVQQLMAAAVGE